MPIHYQDLIITQQLSATHLHWLKNQWQSLGNSLNFSDEIIEAQFQIITKYYNEPHRTYHNLSHIYSLLKFQQQLKRKFRNNPAITLAIWYHDIIYDPNSKTNEIDSAKLFINQIGDLLDEATVKAVNTYIESTTKHLLVEDSKENALFLDMDLAVLAANLTQYTQYTKAIRSEYSIYNDKDFKKGRAAVMSRFLERPTIYYSKLFKKLESIARTNISNEIILLKQ